MTFYLGIGIILVPLYMHKGTVSRIGKTKEKKKKETTF